MTNPNDPANPVWNVERQELDTGLTKREHFAGLIAAAMCADHMNIKSSYEECKQGEAGIDVIARLSVNQADALIKALNK